MKLKRKMMNKLSSLFLVLATSWFMAQNFTGELTTPTKSGFTEIQLGPEVRSAMHNNRAYFRILDSKKNEVAYVVKEHATAVQREYTTPLTIVSKNSIPNVSTSVVIENEAVQKLEELTLRVANTDVVKTYSVSGSNDQNSWFGLVNSETADDLKSEQYTEVEKIIRFPLNNYRFLKIEFNDKKSLPVQVLSASLKKNQDVVQSALLEIDNFKQSLTEDRANKKTIVQLSFDSRQVIDGIQFLISEPKFFRRKAELFVPYVSVKKRQKISTLESAGILQLDSKTQNKFDIGQIFEKNITVEIENEDNAPLMISQIKLFQNPLSVVADLKVGENYTVIVDSTLSVPRYDLDYFEDRFKDDMPKIQVVNLKLDNKDATVKAEEPFWKKPVFMWICIGLALLVIAFFSRGLLKDLSQNP